MAKPARNLAHSVHQRLLNKAREQKEDANLVLIRYALERFLYRLGRSAHKDRFVLKGAMLFAAWTNLPHRPTWSSMTTASASQRSERHRTIPASGSNSPLTSATPN
jgi:hypothetical protein